MSPQSRRRRGLAMWLASSATPLFVVDSRRRVVFFNAGCEKLTGWTAGDVIGQVCDFVSQPDYTQVESLTGVLCPPPQAFEGREQAIPALVVTRDGARQPRLIRFFPLVDENSTVDRVLGAISEIAAPSQSIPTSLDHGLHAELSALRAELRRRYDVENLVGRSAPFHRLMQQVELARRHRSSIHFQGEAGTGKEHLARLIHFQGDTRRRAFIPLDAAVLTRSEIFDAVKRALRDSRDNEPTRLTPGTLYLKNVDRLPDHVQEVLLQECGTVTSPSDWEQAGGAQEEQIRSESPRRLRLMSSSKEPLEFAVRDDHLSDDLYHLLTTQLVTVPSLRDRTEDIPSLAQYFLESLNRDEESQIVEFAEEVWSSFRRYSWPGNLDELRTVIIEARRTCQHPMIRTSDLPFRFRAGVEAQSVGPQQPVEIIPLEDKLAAVEREQITLALEQAGQNKSQAAQLLGMTRPRLYRRMEILGLIDATETPDDQ